MEMLVLPLSEKPFLLAEAGLGTLIGSNKTSSFLLVQASFEDCHWPDVYEYLVISRAAIYLPTSFRISRSYLLKSREVLYAVYLLTSLYVLNPSVEIRKRFEYLLNI